MRLNICYHVLRSNRFPISQEKLMAGLATTAAFWCACHVLSSQTVLILVHFSIRFTPGSQSNQYDCGLMTSSKSKNRPCASSETLHLPLYLILAWIRSRNFCPLSESQSFRIEENLLAVTALFFACHPSSLLMVKINSNSWFTYFFKRFWCTWTDMNGPLDTLQNLMVPLDMTDDCPIWMRRIQENSNPHKELSISMKVPVKNHSPTLSIVGNYSDSVGDFAVCSAVLQFQKPQTGRVLHLHHCV